MPFKNHEKYLEYQRSYYKRRKRNSGPTQELNSKDNVDPGLTPGLNKNILSSKSTIQSAPEQRGVTSTLNPSIPKGLKLSIPTNPPVPLNPDKAATKNARPVAPRLAPPDDISEVTRKHVEELRKQGYEVDSLGNASRIIKE